MSGFSSRFVAFWLALVLLIYLVVGTLFAVYTPAWQSPDEPAHYNYIRYIAEHGRFPVLQPGDYPQDYLEEIKSQKFPSHFPIDPIRYEFYQPPLYYLLATPVFKLFGGALVPLRLLSVVLGAGLVYVACRLALAIFSLRPALALGTAAFVAFVPMHVAMMSAVNNDSLAELLLALALWGVIRYLLGEKEGRGDLAGVGVLLGLGLLTKLYAVATLAVAMAAVILRRRREGRRAARDMALLLGPAMVLVLPWLARNVAVYGWPDVMGLARHDEVVWGQLTTAEFVAQHGWGHLVREGLRTTYQSFWGQFGWMAVPMDRRIYLALGLFSILVIAGLLGWLVVEAVSGRRNLASGRQVDADGYESLTRTGKTREAFVRRLLSAAVLLFSMLLTLFSYVWYNTKFVQHQGRYLFPALIPLGLALALGWWTVVDRVRALVTRIGRLSCVSGLLFALPYAGLALLDVVSLSVFVIPYLS